MAKVGYAGRALADLERLDEVAPGAVALVASAVTALAAHPLLGPVVDAPSGLRKLVISRGKTGYVALYRYDPLHDEVIVAGIRHQREAGFEED